MPQTMAPNEFVGRVGVLRRVFDFLECESPRRRVLVLTGPRGAGRSGLLELLKARSVERDFVLLRFSRRRTTPGQQALDLLRSALGQLTGVAPDPESPVGSWLAELPAEARADVGELAGELRPGAHPARALRCLVKALEALARTLGREVTLALDDPDCLGDAQGYPGVPRVGFPLHKFYVDSRWVRWILAPRYPGSLPDLERREEVELVHLDRLRRADSCHLAALLLERELRPVPRALLWPLHGLADGRPGYLRALVQRVLEEGREARGMPGPAAVRAAFLRELLEPMGRLALACEALAGEGARGTLGRAVLDLLARRGPLGVESVSQLLGIGRDRTLELVRELTRRGLLVESQGRYRLEDRVLAIRFRAQALQVEGDPTTDSRLMALAHEMERGDMALGQPITWERRVREVLRATEGRQLPGSYFGTARAVLTPSGGIEEAAVGYDARGVVDGRPSLVAADLLWNGRDRRWLVEMPRGEELYDALAMRRALRMRAFFARTYRRPIERLWVACEAGFSEEALALAREHKVLVSTPEELTALEGGMLTPAAA